VPQTLPYLSSNKNVAELFEKILAAKKPDAFTHSYLRDMLGLKGTNDRPLISFLKALGFLDAGGHPNPSYDLLKNRNTAKAAIADAVHRAYAPVFAANEKANELQSEPLKGLISQVAGTDQDMTARIAATFSTIAKVADFKAQRPATEETAENENDEDAPARDSGGGSGGLRPEFHYNIQIHLPANGSEETYLNIFNALRKTFR
jgi:Family of unknown function (DUF5343)